MENRVERIKTNPLTIAFIGNLAGGAVMMERPVNSLGVETLLMLPRGSDGLERPEHSGLDINDFQVLEYGPSFSGRSIFSRILARLVHELDAIRVLWKLRNVSLVQSFTGALFFSTVWKTAFGQWAWRPYIACATGSDLREVAALDMGRQGRLMRRFFQRARVTLLLNLDMVRVAEKIGLTNAIFFPFAIDTEVFLPGDQVEKNGDEEVVFFMPSNLDWGASDNQPDRNSTKGNDRLIRAFARLIHSGACARLTLLDRGPDRKEAKKLVSALGIEDAVDFKVQMNRAELVAAMQEADVIADQFDIGAFGTTGLEGMATGKPVMIRIDRDCADQCYSEFPPIINVSSEDEIYEAMCDLMDADYRRTLGGAARNWVEKFHSRDVVGQKLMEIYEGILAL